MALFGLECGPKEANRQALLAAAQVDGRLYALRDRLAQELGWTADFVIHLHTGSAGIGETGDYAMRTLTAVGNTIDVARQLAAQHDDGEIARIVISEAVMIAAGLDARATTWREIVLANAARLKVTSIDSATALFKAKAVISTIGGMHHAPR